MGLIALITSTGNANSTRLRLAQFHALLVPVTRAINPHIALSTVLLTIHIVPMAKLSFERGFLASVQWGMDYCPLYRAAGCPLFRGFYCIRVYGETIGTFDIVRCIVHGCQPMRGVR